MKYSIRFEIKLRFDTKVLFILAYINLIQKKTNLMFAVF